MPHGAPIVPVPSRRRNSADLQLSVRPKINLQAVQKVSYHGGPLIRNANIFAFYWGTAWGNDPGLAAMSEQMNQFLTDFVSGTPMDLLREYSRPNYAIGRGLFRTPGWVIDNSEPPNGISDQDIQKSIQTWIGDLNLDRDQDSLFLLFLPPKIDTTAPWGKSCQQYCGYHWNAGDVYYAVLPYPCPRCSGGFGILDTLKIIASHEIYEAVTDPVFKQGWWDEQNDEIGDICEKTSPSVATFHTPDGRNHLIQTVWSNNTGACLTPAAAFV